MEICHKKLDIVSFTEVYV